jgi:hypothetical protein
MKTLVILVICLFCQVVLGGHQKAKVALDVRLRKDKPTVYIEFERSGNREALFARESNKGIWMQLHNNTKWSIVLNMHGVPSDDYGDASLIYDVLSDRQIVIDGACHVCSFNSLGSGRSLLFSIPAEHLSNGRALRVKFSYSWEGQSGHVTGQEPEHYVYFYASQLPTSSQKSTE